GTLALGVLGIVMERLVIRYFYARPHEDQLLVTFGLSIVFVEAVRWYFSSDSKTVQAPALFQGITNMGFMFYPTYRLAVVGICAVALLVLFLVLYRTRLGMIVRAGIEDSVMVDSLGINVDRVFMVVFGIGAMAAGFAGIINAPIVSLTPEVGEQILVQTFVVVVIGGVGSFPGAVLGGLIAGEIISLTSMVNPGYAYVMLFAAMTLVLMVRPRGLLGAAGRECRRSSHENASSLSRRNADRRRADPGAVHPALSRLCPEHGEPHSGVGPVRHRLRHSVRLHGPAV